MSLSFLSYLLVLLLSFTTVVRSHPFSEPQSSNSQPSSRQQKSRPHAENSASERGIVADGVYRNAAFGFSYKIPAGWVDRTPDMSADAQAGEAGKALVLLTVFERPPEAIGDTVNSAVIIAAESTSSYPGVKTAADYFEPLTELTASKGFKVVNEPYEFSAGTRSVVRGDFSKEVGKLTMFQSSLATLQKGYVLSFTFLGGSEDEVDDLIERLNFRAMKGPAPIKSPGTR
jgi:hypothetical protein